MWPAIIKAVIEAVVRVFISILTTLMIRDAGRLRERADEQEKIIDDQKKAKDISDRVDGLSDAELEQLRRKLNDRP